MEHFNWFELVPGVGHEYIHVATAIFVTLLIILLSLAARMALGTGEKFHEPARRFSIKGIFEVCLEFIIDLTDMMLGKDGPIYIPLFGAIFVYILVNNIMGLFPGMTPATDNFNTTISVGLFVFVTYNFLGIKTHGLAYFKHFMGPVLWLAFLMIPIEIISHMVRPLSLGLRLGGNMIGDHTVLGIFTSLTKIGIPVIFYGLGLFVCFVQAFVFTLLSMVYVSMATAHEH